MPNVHVSLAHRSYDIAIGHGILAQTSARCRDWCGLDAPGSALVVTDSNLADSHAATVADGFESDGWLATCSSPENPRSLSRRLEACTTRWSNCRRIGARWWWL